MFRKGVLRKKEFRTGKEVHPYFKDIGDIVEGKKDNLILIQYDGVD